MQDIDRKDFQCDPKILEIFNNEKYAKLAYDSHETYKNNEPFPHIVLDDFLPLSFAKIISNECPKVSDNTSNF